MSIEIKVTSFAEVGDNLFTAAGTCDGEAFTARTIVYRNEPIFKVQEANDEGEFGLRRLDESSFSRGQRIAIARRLKQVRLDGGLPAEDLSDLSVKELRARAKEAGLSGYHAKGVRKADLVAMLAA